MKCSKCKKLIHRMLDGDLNRREQREVSAHLEACDDCRSYYRDMAGLCSALREPDREMPAGFRQQWKQQIAAAAADEPRRAPRKRLRPAVLVPVVACCVAAMFVVSTILVNPQAFGLEGESVTGEWFLAVGPKATPEPAPSIDQGTGQQVNFVAKSEKKPNLLDFENSDYSETTTTASRGSALSASGTIEPKPNEVYETIKGALEEHGTALPDETPVLSLSVSDEERERLRELAGQMDVRVVSDDESGTVLEGSPEQIGEVAAGHHLEIPEEAELVRLHLES